MPPRIIAIGPHGFGGSVQIFCRWLHTIAEAVRSVHYVSYSHPIPLKTLKPERVHYVPAVPFEANAMGRPNSPVPDKQMLTELVLAEKAVEIARTTPNTPIILWGSYLFPFAPACLRAARILEEIGQDVEVWLTPAGSDVWELGPNLPYITHQLLVDPLVTQVITYSKPFAGEIKERYDVQRHIHTVRPVIDTSRFYKPTPAQRASYRQRLHLPENAFVISSHNNMRPVKRPRDTMRIADNIAEQSHRPVVLLMVGPIREELVEFAKKHVKHVDLRWEGVTLNVENYLYAADVEINCSWHDSFNLSLTESMACGVPVVSTDIVGVAPDITAADAGFLFPSPSSTEDGALDINPAIAFILDLTQDETKRQAMADRGAAYVADVFAPNQILAQYIPMLSP
jgi:glycosyltransferase involved in cell wall biosynthesis